MTIVQCEMCEDLHEITEWKESDLFICKICAEILSEIKKRRIKGEKHFSKGFWLFEFDYMRQLKREEMSKR